MSTRTRALALLASGGLAAAALSPAALSPALGAADAAADRRTPDARVTGGWRTVSSGAVDTLSEITLARTADGVLHAVYQQDVGSADELEHAAIATSGSVLARSKPVGTWATLVHNPKLLRTPTGGLRLVFSGLQDTDTANFYSQGHAYDTVSDASGAAWSLQPRALTRFDDAYSGYGTGATTLSDGTAVTAASLNSETHYRVGTIDTTDPATASAAAPDGVASAGAGGYYWHTQLVNSGDTVWMVTYVDGASEASEGIFAQQVHPTPGPVLKAPGSTTGGSSLNPDQTVAAVARPGGGVVVAYKTGYPTADAISVWQVGGGVRRIRSDDVDQVALDTGSTGRLWLAWVDGSNEVRAARSGPSGLGFGAVQSLGRPGSGADLWRIAVDASLDQGTVLVNDVTTRRVSLRTVEPGLSLSASGGLRRSRTGSVRVKVTDAGDAVKGARVTGGGDSCTTNARGRCTMRVTPRRAGKVSFVAVEDGYGSGRDVVKVKR
ncbi:hypothetical protein HN031_07700 [Nocardioides sp. zg-1308]|uniref:hypothetical protein n=1 Tax=Nocardioides sp. zg-1308 TaxID=2736253 RepID=UPI001556D27E|nr:hypothetical protein [Nocardioides sp. zg-1308]NPD04566.1 hypothetical protein [Nocardioides sp. zg-1308]